LIKFTLMIEPVAWERVKRSRDGHAYVPPKTRKFKIDCARQAWSHRPNQILDGPLELTVKFYIPRPKRPKYDQPASRPDLDNYVKALKDALNEVIWTDDARVCRYGAGTGKYYVMGAIERPRIEVTVDLIEQTKGTK
jgi:Holliday junction resolvase RusA-like endonuclease